MLGLLPTLVQPESAILASAPMMWVDARWVDATPGAAKRDRSGSGNDWVHVVAGGGGLAVTTTSTGAPALNFTGDTNERLATASINLSGTDKVTLAIVFESSSSSTGVFTEFSENYNSHTDAFLTTRSGSGTISPALRNGSGAYNLFETTESGVGDPQTVDFITYDRGASAADEEAVYIDGVMAPGSKAASDPSSGNFGNYPLHIGDRLAGSTAPITSKTAQMLMWNRLLSSDEIKAITAEMQAIAG